MARMNSKAARQADAILSYRCRREICCEAWAQLQRENDACQAGLHAAHCAARERDRHQAWIGLANESARALKELGIPL